MSLSVRAVDRALAILLCFTPSDGGLTLTEIAERVEIHKSTAHRLLATLEARRFVHRDKASGLYRPGVQLVELASLVLRDMDLQRWAEPYLQSLSAECGEAVDLAALDGNAVVYLQVIDSPKRIKIAAAVGQRLPVHCTATGKAFLAFLPPGQVTEILGGDLRRYTSNTVVGIPDLRRELQLTRQRGYAMSEEEFEPDINALAAPVLDAHGFPVAVVAVVGPSFRLTRERMLSLGPALLATTQAIAREAGLEALSRLLPTRGFTSPVEPTPERTR